MRIVGIDLGIRKVAVAHLQDDMLVATEAYASTEYLRTTQLMDLGHWVSAMVAECDADLVAIEEPLVGNNRRYSLRIAEVFGALLAQLGELQQERQLDVVSVNVQNWKKQLLGKGNATKLSVREYIDGVDEAYADICGDDQDRYDAAAIGLYGWRLHATAQLSIIRANERRILEGV
jgi:Holliday junction resolvasome RuvABC endonuclease subunit